jgi:hypothetical protein
MSYFGGISSFYIELIVYIPRVNFIKQNILIFLNLKKNIIYALKSILKTSSIIYTLIENTLCYIWVNNNL